MGTPTSLRFHPLRAPRRPWRKLTPKKSKSKQNSIVLLIFFEDNSSSLVLLVFATDEFAWHVFQFYVFGLQIWEEKKRSKHGSILSIFKTSKLMSCFPFLHPSFLATSSRHHGGSLAPKIVKFHKQKVHPPPKKNGWKPKIPLSRKRFQTSTQTTQGLGGSSH